MSTGKISERRLLCEGWIEEGSEHAAVFLPEIAYVRQGDKVWMAYGDRSRLDESTSDAHFVERIDEMELEERTLTTGAVVKLPKDGRWIVEGPAQRSDVRNANRRVYPRKLWEKLIADRKSYVQEQIAERAMIGHLEHPKDGRTDLKEAAIITIEASLQEDGTVWNKFEILDTPNGSILKELTLKGVRWGVSSRGNGSVDDSGTVSESDFLLKCWDAVAAPSTPGAYARRIVTESSGALHENAGAETLMRRANAHPRALDYLSNIGEMIEWRTDVALALCLHLLEDVNLPDKQFAEVAKLFTRIARKNTAESVQDALSVRVESSLEALDVLSESECDEAHADRLTRVDGLLRVLGSIDETTAEDLLTHAAGWTKIQRAVERTRELLTGVSNTSRLDEAIDAAIEGSETREDSEGLMHVVEALQAQIADSVQESAELRGRLEVAESAKRALQEAHDEVLEQHSRSREELARVQRQRDLTSELLSEATARPDDDRRADARVDEALADRPQLEPYRDLLVEAERKGQLNDVVERLDPPKTAKPVAKPFQARRSSLPAGLVESLDVPLTSQTQRQVSVGARLAGRVTPGALKTDQ